MKKDLDLGSVQAYYTAPEGEGKLPALIVIEEIWGLNAHIKNVADRFAAKGYTVLSPEILPKSLLDMITPELQASLADPKKRDEAQPRLRAAMSPIQSPDYAKDAVAQLKQCVDYLLNDPRSNGKVGVLGFCFGGSYAFHLAAQDSRIGAAVPFYGQPPKDNEIETIFSPVLAFYGAEDTHLIETLPKLKEDMEKAGKRFEAVVYPDTGHAFFNDTNPMRYNAADAKDAWEKTLAFLLAHLSAGILS
jgi:carboxymethylenebutenolidase